MLSATQFSAPFYGQQIGDVFTTLREAGRSSWKYTVCPWSWFASLWFSRQPGDTRIHLPDGTHSLPQQQSREKNVIFSIPAPACSRDKFATDKRSGFMSIPVVASSHHWWLDHIGNLIFFYELSILFWGVCPFPAYDDNASVLMARPVVAIVSSKTLDVCRSSVRSIRGDMSFLHVYFIK